MNEDILKLVDRKFEDLELNSSAKELVALFIEDMMKHENVLLKDVVSAGSGKTGINLKIGEYILKVGRTRRTKTFRNNPRILQPIIRREIEVSTEEKIFVEVQNEVDTEWFKREKNVFETMYQVYKDIRDAGLFWSDVGFRNVGKLLKDNKINYETTVHDLEGNIIRKEIEPAEKATGIKGGTDKILKAGDYVILDTDFIFEENDLPDNRTTKEMLIDLFYNNFELRYMREKKAREEDVNR